MVTEESEWGRHPTLALQSRSSKEEAPKETAPVSKPCGATIYSSPATPSQEHGFCPLLGFQPPFLLNIAGRKQCSAERPAEGTKVCV